MQVDNPNDFRCNIRKKLNKIIKKTFISLNLEKGIYNYAIKKCKEKNIVRSWSNKAFVMIYLDKLKSIMINLKINKNDKSNNLLKNLKKGAFKPHELAFMSHQEMAPEKWQHLIDAKIKRDKKEGEVDLSAASDEFFCFKCKKRKCTYYEMQTRSADEPMTTFVTCLLCGNNWRC
jgi:transcription elongation factor S-II